MQLSGPMLVEQLRAQLTRRADAPIMTFDREVVSGAELLELVDAKARCFRKMGIGETSRVGTIASPPLEFVSDVFATLAVGAVVVPLPTTITAWELARAHASAQLTHLATAPGSTLARAPGVDVCGRRVHSGLSVARDSYGASAALLTSGTTGRERVALRSGAALASEAGHYRDALALDPAQDVIACLLPLHHAYAFGLCVLAAPLAGVRVHYISTLATRVVLDELHRSDATLLPAVPPLLRILAGTPRPGWDTHKLRLLSAGAPLDRRTAVLAGTRLGRSIGQVYGTTETGPICVLPPGDWRAAAAGVGPPLPGVDVRIHDESVDDGPAAGAVSVSSPSLMLGYATPNGLDASAVEGGRFTTGDLGELHDGRLTLVGRLSNCISVGGAKVSPEEIEAAILEFPAVRSALVVGVDDERLGQRVKAFVTPTDVDLAALHRFCRQRLSATKLPQLYEAVPTLATTAMGKAIRARPAVQ